MGLPLCAYCSHHAAYRIPAEPSQVCAYHAREYWTALLEYVRVCRGVPRHTPELPPDGLATLTETLTRTLAEPPARPTHLSNS